MGTWFVSRNIWDEKDDIISSISIYVAKQPSTITLRCRMRNQPGIHRRKPLSVRVGIKQSRERVLAFIWGLERAQPMISEPQAKVNQSKMFVINLCTETYAQKGTLRHRTLGLCCVAVVV